MVNRSTIIAQFEEVAREQGKKLAPLSDDLVLLELGLELAVHGDHRRSPRGTRWVVIRSMPPKTLTFL